MSFFYNLIKNLIEFSEKRIDNIYYFRNVI